MCMHREKAMRMQKEDSHLQAKASGENNPVVSLILDFQPPEL